MGTLAGPPELQHPFQCGGLGCSFSADRPACPSALVSLHDTIPIPPFPPLLRCVHAFCPPLSFSLSVLAPLPISLQLHRPSVLHGSRPQQVRGSPLPRPPLLSSLLPSPMPVAFTFLLSSSPPCTLISSISARTCPSSLLLVPPSPLLWASIPSWRGLFLSFFPRIPSHAPCQPSPELPPPAPRPSLRVPLLTPRPVPDHSRLSCQGPRPHLLPVCPFPFPQLYGHGSPPFPNQGKATPTTPWWG